ncbi:MAG: ABC transporter permease, partial [candidate division Zixibacteria bacterium]|nr:ABC transporter permease [candidate division Zixibacteria bacterium]
MDYRQIAKVSFESLGAHKLRTTLTMLGVIFGVAAVIAMLSIGEGAKEEALEQISILGINNIIVNAKVLDETAEAKSGSQRSLGLSIADGENIARFPELVANVVPQRFEALGNVNANGNQSPARVVATTPEFVLSSSIE